MVSCIWICLMFGVQAEVTVALEEVDVYRCRSIAASPNGVVALVDRDAPHVVLLDGEGRLIKRLADNGHGPKELGRPFEVCWVDDEAVFAVFDPGNARLSKWTEAGVWVSDTPLARGGISPLFARDGRFFTTEDAYGMNSRRPKLMHYSLNGGTGTLVWSFQLDASRTFSTGINQGNEFRIMYRWDPALLFGVGGDFLAVAFSSEARVHLLDFQGQPVRPPLPFSLPRFPVSDAQLAAGVDLMPANLHSGLSKGLVKPDGWPYLRRILVDEQDRIFLIGANREVGAPHPMLAYSPEGRLLHKGRINGMAMVARGGFLYYLSEGAESLVLGKVAYTI